jgi:hypothetical protein
MAATPIWGEVTDHLVEVIAAAEGLAGVQVCDGMPGEMAQTGPELLIVDDEITSTASMPVGVGGAKPYDDIFEVLLRISVKGRATRAEARDRLAEIDAAVHTLLAGDPSLGDLDGVLSAGIVRRRRVVSNTTEGPMAYGEIYLSIHSRIVPD